MGTRRRKRVVHKTRKKGGALLSPEQTRIVAIRSRGKNHSQKMAEHLRGLVEQLKEQYNGNAYQTFLKKQAEEWSKAAPRSLKRLYLIHDIARYRLKRKWMIRDILTLRNQEAQNISNYMKTAASKKLSNHSRSLLSHQLQQQAINNSIIEIEKRIHAWKNNLPEHPIALFDFKDDTYYKIAMIDPTYDKPIDDSIRIIMKEDQYPMVDEWIAGCRDLLHTIKSDLSDTGNVSELYLLLYFVLKNYASALKTQADIVMKRNRKGTFRPEDYKHCNNVRVHAAEIYLEWKQYQLLHKFVRVHPITVSQAEAQLGSIKKLGCSSAI